MTIDDLIETLENLKKDGVSGRLPVRYETAKPNGGSNLLSLEDVVLFTEWNEPDGAHDWDEALTPSTATFVMVW